MMKHSTKLGAICVAGLVGLGTMTPASAASSGVHRSFYEKNTSFTYTTPSGGIAAPPQGPPAPGSQIEFTDLDYAGSAKHHQAAWTASDHFVCAFSAQGVPTCQGQLSIGGSMLLVSGTGGQGAFTIPIVGGTGAFAGDKGTLKVGDLGQTLNANLEVSASR